MSYLDILPSEILKEICLHLDIAEIINIRDLYPKILEDEYFWSRYYIQRDRIFTKIPSKADFYISTFIRHLNRGNISDIVESAKRSISDQHSIVQSKISRYPKIGLFDGPKYYLLLSLFNKLLHPALHPRTLDVYITKVDGMYNFSVIIETYETQNNLIEETLNKNLYQEFKDGFIHVDEGVLNEKEFEIYLDYVYE